MLCDEADWFEADSTDKLEKIIDDYRENYELVRLQRRAFVCEGRRFCARNNRSDVADVRFVACFDRDLDFRANSYHVSGQNEQWHQQLLYRGKLHRRLGPFHADVFKPIEDEAELKAARDTIRIVSPIDNSILPGRFIDTQAPHLGAGVKLTVGKLVSGEFGPAGSIIQKIRRDGGIRPVQDEFVWSRLAGTDVYLPTKYEFFYVEKDGELRRASAVKTNWKETSDLFVPSSMMILEHRKNYRLVVNLSVEYVFGERMGKSPVIEPEMADWREPIRVLFDKEWLRRGGVIPLRTPLVER